MGRHTDRNGLLSRRHFVVGGVGLLVATLDTLAAPDLPPSMTRPGAGFSVYGQPSPQERPTARAIADNCDLAGNGVS
jgi:sulfane dehydrogenase subunit SoxC